MARPIAVDLFAGAGGMSLGFEQAGFDVVAAVELDPVHACVHEFNFPNWATLCRDVTAVSGEEIRAAAAIGSRSIDVVVGGAPCQGFSLIGHRALEDPRNSLVKHFLRLVRELNASYFVFENVKGLTLGRHRTFLDELVEEFEKDYSVVKPWRILNAADYGVPQNRERLILIGAKKGLSLPQYPTTILKRITCEDALDDLPDAEWFPTLLQTDEVQLPVTAWKYPSRYAREMRCLDNDAWHFGYVRDWKPNSLTSSMRTTHSEISRRRFLETQGDDTEPISRFFKLSAAGLSNTLRAGTDAARGAFTSPRPIHYRYPRCVTVREMARLHGFPDWFRFQQTKWHGARQIGNAVPPPLARAVGASLVAAMGLVPERLHNEVSLGNPALLAMDLGAASAHWNIESPIGRRDRKSGARKRKQHEIEAELQRLRVASA